MVNHFLDVTIKKGNMPDLHFLEIQEELGLQFLPQQIDIDEQMQILSIAITPFTIEVVNSSLKRSKNWLKTRKFADSWFIENSLIDKLVNSCSSIVDGVKICNLDEATSLVFDKSMKKLTR